MAVAGPAAAALQSLRPDQLRFIQSISKAELHAHLNGCIPIAVLQDLAREYTTSETPGGLPGEEIQSGLAKLVDGPNLNEISDFFSLFPAIYALTATPSSLACVTSAVLKSFLDGEHPQCQYLELRTTPKETSEMTREKYVRVVLEELARYGKKRTGLIVSLDRRMGEEVMRECIGIAKKLKAEGEAVVGVDLCGDPTAGNVEVFRCHFEDAREAGLGVTLHVAETIHNSTQETLQFLCFPHQRLGHATFLDEQARDIVTERKTCIEICLSSNLLCKTVASLDAHHIRYYLEHKHPIAICTDDTLPFRTSLEGEYALLMAQPPLGLGLSEEEVKMIGEMGMDARFANS